jgi:peptidylamidoglycolate lyase
VDPRSPETPSLLIAMSDQQHLLQLSLDGLAPRRFPLPGGNPRQIRFQKNHFFVPHLADNWPKNRNSRGFVSVLDQEFRVVSNLGGTQPEYSKAGELLPMRAAEPVFQHPHDVLPAADGCVYVAQFASGNTYPVKLEPV